MIAVGGGAVGTRGRAAAGRGPTWPRCISLTAVRHSRFRS